MLLSGSRGESRHDESGSPHWVHDAGLWLRDREVPGDRHASRSDLRRGKRRRLRCTMRIAGITRSRRPDLARTVPVTKSLRPVSCYHSRMHLARKPARLPKPYSLPDSHPSRHPPVLSRGLSRCAPFSDAGVDFCNRHVTSLQPRRPLPHLRRHAAARALSGLDRRLDCAAAAGAGSRPARCS